MSNQKKQLTSDDPVGWYMATVANLPGQDVFVWWNGRCLEHPSGEMAGLVSVKNIVRVYYEDDIEKLKNEVEELRGLRMRRADKPDCLGIWVTQLGEFLIIDTELRLNDVKGEKAPYFYYGPIPVIPKDLPKIKEFKLRRSNGLEISAVQYGFLKNYHRVLEDGSVGDVVEGKFEVVEG